MTQGQPSRPKRPALASHPLMRVRRDSLDRIIPRPRPKDLDPAASWWFCCGSVSGSPATPTNLEGEVEVRCPWCNTLYGWELPDGYDAAYEVALIDRVRFQEANPDA